MGVEGKIYVTVKLQNTPYKEKILGRLGSSVLKHLPSALGMILESRDRIPHRATCMEPASPFACVFASLSVSHDRDIYL